MKSQGASEKPYDNMEHIKKERVTGQMNQQTSFLSLGCLTKRTRADQFLDEMNRVVPWSELAAVRPVPSRSEKEAMAV